MVTYGILLNLTDSERRHGKNLSNSAFLTTMFAAGEASTYVIGAIVTAMTQKLLKNRLKYILVVCTFIMGSCLMLWEFTANNINTHQTTAYILSYVTGFCLGPSISFLFPAGEELTNLPGHLAYPFSLGGMGIGMTLSPTLTAMVAQAFAYKGFFLVQGLLIYIKFICLCTSIILLRNFNMDSNHGNLNVHDRNDYVDRDEHSIKSALLEKDTDMKHEYYQQRVVDDYVNEASLNNNIIPAIADNTAYFRQSTTADYTEIPNRKKISYYIVTITIL